MMVIILQCCKGWFLYTIHSIEYWLNWSCNQFSHKFDTNNSSQTLYHHENWGYFCYCNIHKIDQSTIRNYHRENDFTFTIFISVEWIMWFIGWWIHWIHENLIMILFSVTWQASNRSYCPIDYFNYLMYFILGLNLTDKEIFRSVPPRFSCSYYSLICIENDEIRSIFCTENNFQEVKWTAKVDTL